MKPSKSFMKWINSCHQNSPLFYIIRDDEAVKKAREQEDDLPKTEEDKEKEEKESFLKLQQAYTTQRN